MNADIIALQEIESKEALEDLQKLTLYPYAVIADKKKSTVKNALLSKFKIIASDELFVDRFGYRNILEVKVDINGKPLTLFVNHWKSKGGAESLRVLSAKVLKRRIDQLSDQDEFIILGDLNSNYNEHQTFIKKRKHNDTKGVTGINHILKTIKNDKLIQWSDLYEQKNNEYLYNLWLDFDKKSRWSHNFFGKKGSLDNIIITKALADNKDIEYIKKSFQRFAPKYLFYKRAINRWKISRKQPKHHTLHGYSDHLPLYADFIVK